MDHLTPRPDLYDVPYQAEDFRGMPYRQVGASGLRASAIGLGTWKFGYPHTGDGARVDERTAFAIFDRAVELGVTFWDTANRYNNGSGNSERLIGRWLRANPDQRRDIVLATKAHGGMDGATPNHSGLSRGNIVDAVHASLARLQLDHVDVLYFHRFDPTVPIEESLETIEDLVREGLIRYFAVSNFTRDQLASYLEVQGGLSRRCRPVAVQNRFDPLNREPDDYVGTLAYCAAQGIAYVPYSPLAGGLLTRRYLDPSGAGAGDRLHDEGRLESVATEEKLAGVRRLLKLAEAWEVEVSQLALAYLLTLPGMGPQIPSSSTVAQLESNAAAGRIRLDEQQIAEVEAALAG
ncbi:aldo/keto reductase [Actinopolymorpha pittospori]|uniref:Aryl-alcohol dehydrogenase-like predicted oxidoreductase n=1 Tax=Actinopolymorpha pittospori TaxID=648752 RepID=A0A927N2R4_9ACTN|nr:aldo/keto reductase [Actinopolymorpha pittospori]MBE1611064.1 aryl-alcohol dehydrogenase-like predicted oxidoreductase [Actinopolymorpha pittospori]